MQSTLEAIIDVRSAAVNLDGGARSNCAAGGTSAPPRHGAGEPTRSPRTGRGEPSSDGVPGFVAAEAKLSPPVILDRDGRAGFARAGGRAGVVDTDGRVALAGER